MKPRLLCLALLLPIMPLIPGCASNQTLSSRDRAAIHRVAVNHTIAIDSRDNRSGAGRVARQVVPTAAGYGLGIPGAGLLAGLAMDAVPSRPAAGNDVSQVALRILADARTDPGELLAARMEKELGANGFTIDGRTPDAAFHFELQKLTMVPADDLKLRHRPALGVRATLIGAKGRTLWSHSASEASDGPAALTWHEYSAQPRKLRAEIDTLAARLARHFVAELKR